MTAVKRITATCCIALVTTPIQAITLSEYVAESVQAHPAVRQQIHHYRQIAQDREMALSGWRPSVTIDASSGAYSTESPITFQQRRDYNSSRGTVTLNQNLFAGFETTARLNQTQARISSAVHLIYDEADNIALEAIRAYLEVLKQNRLIELAYKNVENHLRILSQLQERHNSGAGRRSEVEQTEGRLARARASWIAQQNNLQDALTQLHVFLGRYVGPDELEEPNIPTELEGNLEQVIQDALEQHPAVQVAHYNIEAALADYRRSKSSNYPRVDLRLQRLLGDDLNGYVGPTDEYSAVVNLSYTLYAGGANRALQRQRISAVHENQAFSARTRRQVIETLRLAWMADQALFKQREYLGEHAQKAQQTAESYYEEFFIGQRDLLDLLDAEGEQNSAQIRVAESRYDSMIARYRTYEAVGDLFDTLSLSVLVEDSDLQIGTLQARGTDRLPLPVDRDDDGRADRVDECDNTPDRTVDTYGCDRRNPTEFDYLDTLAEHDIQPVEFLNFLLDSTDLTPKSAIRMESIIAVLRPLRLVYFDIYGHTDASGSAEYNRKLSRRRANAIKKRLLEAGIDERRIRTFGRGFSEPVANNSTPEGLARNRRAEIRFTPMTVD
jgi:outer membrane protein, adhesin transport system